MDYKRIGAIFMRPNTRRNFRASFNASNEECRKALAEYSYLASLPTLSEEQAIRVADILQLSESNDILSCLINEIDEMTFQEQGFYDDSELMTHFKNESAKVQENILSENERQILLCFSTTRGFEQVRYCPPKFDRPRMEMVFDATRTHALRQSLNQLLLLEQAASIPLYDDIYVSNGHLVRKKATPLSFSQWFYNVFVEESVSVLTIAALVLLVCLIAL